MNYQRFLEPGEQTVQIIRRHPVAFLPSIFIFAVMLCTPPLFLLLITGAVPLSLAGQALDWVVVGFGCYYLFVLAVGLVLWMDYYYDLYIITTRHILDVDQGSLLGNRIAHTSLARVQDVTTRLNGVWQQVFNFGPINVQTAGHEEDILLEDVPRPHEVAATIMRLHDELIAREQRRPEVGEAEGVHPAKPPPGN